MLDIVGYCECGIVSLGGRDAGGVPRFYCGRRISRPYVPVQWGMCRWTPLHHVVYDGFFFIVKVFIRAGAVIDYRAVQDVISGNAVCNASLASRTWDLFKVGHEIVVEHFAKEYKKKEDYPFLSTGVPCNNGNGQQPWKGDTFPSAASLPPVTGGEGWNRLLEGGSDWAKKRAENS